MAAPVLDAVGVTSREMKKTVAFYALLGFQFPDFSDEDQHVEALGPPGAVRLMIDSAELAKSLIGEEPRPGNGSAFALLYDSPEAVDVAAAAVQAGGYTVIDEPKDAFWGHRYATVADPDGYRVDLFARL